MCRSIKQLRGADQPAAAAEVQAAALQYVRKVSGYRAPSRVNQDAFDTAVAEIAAATQRLLDRLSQTTPARAGGDVATDTHSHQRRITDGIVERA